MRARRLAEPLRVGARAALLLRVTIAACGALAFDACAPQKPPAQAAPKAPQVQGELARFLPLEDATVFAYDTTSDTSAQKGLLVMEVRRPRPARAELVVAGRVRRLEIETDGFRHVTGGWLLKAPLALGAKFPGDFGTVEVSAIEQRVDVPAGRFEHCVETTEALATTEFSKKTVTSFCPNVGIALRRTEAESSEGAGSERLELRSFGPRVDLSR